MGGRYASSRNHDGGPSARGNVSTLSPWVRRRLVGEAELVAAAVADHGASAAEKFVQEVFWRSYWKGWLEMRPGVWRAYRDGLSADRAALGEDRRLARRVAEAEEGRTGLDCFDAWATELVETGYLHNHARMWFASIWIFTLRLPWRLGADFFLRHLIDGDPASNTLGWRWVAGLHTQGKAYVAQAWNIAKFTGGRFRPDPRDLAENAEPLPWDAPPPPLPLAPAPPLDPSAPTALLITEEDCLPETLGIEARGLALSRLRAAATLQITAARSDAAVGPLVEAFDRGALEDAARRAEAAGAPVVERLSAVAPEDLARWAARAGATQIVTAWVPVGPVRDWLEAARPALGDVRVAMVRRQWDDAVWPHATAGFFRVKKEIPALLRALT
ncbi:MAG: deoxyribodipyrimidine photolyase [Rhodobacteraceae bacterium]|nr:MAG: deoxyribodipyrimidine photolyase [Paracoccaceae bacterium]